LSRVATPLEGRRGCARRVSPDAPSARRAPRLPGRALGARQRRRGVDEHAPRLERRRAALRGRLEQQGPALLPVAPARVPRAPSGDCTIGAELPLGLLATHLLAAAACAALGALLLRGAARGLLFGAVGALVLWNSLVGAWFATEVAAAPFAIAALALWVANRREPSALDSAALAARLSSPCPRELEVSSPTGRSIPSCAVSRPVASCATPSSGAFWRPRFSSRPSASTRRRGPFLRTLDAGSYGTPILAAKARELLAGEHLLGSPQRAHRPRCAGPASTAACGRRGSGSSSPTLASRRSRGPLQAPSRLSPLPPSRSGWRPSRAAALPPRLHSSSHRSSCLAAPPRAVALLDGGVEPPPCLAAVCSARRRLMASEVREQESRFVIHSRPESVANARTPARRFRERLRRGRRWLSLLNNGYPPLLARGVKRPSTGSSTPTPYLFPEWAEAEARRASTRGGPCGAARPCRSPEPGAGGDRRGSDGAVSSRRPRSRAAYRARPQYWDCRPRSAEAVKRCRGGKVRTQSAVHSSSTAGSAHRVLRLAVLAVETAAAAAARPLGSFAKLGALQEPHGVRIEDRGEAAPFPCRRLTAPSGNERRG